MTAAELYQLGEKAYAEDRYEDALRYYTAAAPQNADAAATVPLCHMGLASQVSLDVSEHADNTEYLVRGQQLAVKVYDTAIRSALALYRDYPDYPYVCNVAPLVICTSLNAQYSLVSTGLTTAYRITSTTTTVRKTVLQTKQGGQVINNDKKMCCSQTDSTFFFFEAGRSACSVIFCCFTAHAGSKEPVCR